MKTQDKIINAIDTATKKAMPYIGTAFFIWLFTMIILRA